MQAFSRTPRTSRTRQMGLAGAGAALAVASTTEAGMILSPTSVVSNSIGEFNAPHDIGNVIDQSGLSSSFVSGTTDYATYLLTSPTHNTKSKHNIWFSPRDSTTGSIVFDLGDVYSIERLAIWQGGASSGSGSGIEVDLNIDSISLETSTDVAFTTPFAAGSFNVPQDANVAAYPVNNFDLTDSTGRYVRLTINSNHGGLDQSKFGELAFDVSAVSAVPEPAAALLLLLAAGLALVVKRLRGIKPATTGTPV